MNLISQFLALSIFVFFQQIIRVSSSACSSYLPDSTFTCGSPHLYTSTNLKIPSPSKTLAISFTLTPSSYCVAGGSDSILFSVQITIPGTTTQKKVMYISHAFATNTIESSTQDINAFQGIYNQGLSTFFNQPISIYMGIDLTSTSASAKYALAFGNLRYSASLTTQSYGANWVFDSSTVMTLCGNENGNYGVNCIAQNLQVAYKVPDQFITMPFSYAMMMVGNYLLNKGSGNSLANSKGTLGSASLSSSPSPIWTADSGLEFNSQINQYIQITNFVPSGEPVYATTSLAFAFYLKIDSAPTTDATIVSHEVNNLGMEILNLALSPTMTLKLDFMGTNSQTVETLTVGKWTSLYVFYASTKGGFGIARLYIDGVSSSALPTVSSSLVPSDFMLSDTIKIGGAFSGNIRRIQVYSPASVGIASSNSKHLCDSSSCSLEIGFSNPPTCLKAVCPAGFYSIFERCEACPKGCATCTDQDTCQSCSSQYYLINNDCVKCPEGKYADTATTCADCPKHCSSCTDLSTCTSCYNGYGIYTDNLCMLCSAGTYLSHDGFCKEFSETLQDTLSGSQLANSAVTQAANIISQGSAISLSAAVSGRIFSQIKYLNISYSGELQVALLTWLPSFVSLGLTPNMPESMNGKIPQRPVPYVFEKYYVPSSFLINFWESLGVVVFVSFLWLLFKGVEWKITKPRAALILKKARVMTQNFLITALYGVYGDLVMFTIIEYRTLIFGWNLSLLSFLISFILVIVMFLSFLYQIKLLLTYQKLKRQNPNNLQQLDQFTKKNEGSQAYWKDFKDYSLAPQLFLFFLSGRDIIFSLILATMFEYPLAQTIIFILLDCLMLVYLFIKKPFESKFDFVQQLFFEFIALIVNLNVGINAILDAGKYEAISARDNIGKLIIVCNMLFNFVTAGFMLICIVQASRKFYQNIKRKRVKKLEILKRKTKAPEKCAALQNIDSEQSSMPEDNNTSQNLSLQYESSELRFLPNHRPMPQKTPNRELNNQPRYNPTQVAERSQQIYQPQKNPRIKRSQNEIITRRPQLKHNSPFQPYPEN